MSRTYRNVFYQQCALKTPKHRAAKQAQSENKDLCEEYGIFLGNRALNRKIPNPWDDIVISSLGESKYQRCAND
jgi:hypothetical protein